MLLNRWSANRNVDAERRQLAQKQFDFYAEELKVANPFSSENDTAAVEKARRYLALFAGFERVYQAMLADAAKNTAPLNFNKRFPGSAEVVVDSQDVAGPFTKPGWEFMKNSLKNPAEILQPANSGCWAIRAPPTSTSPNSDSNWPSAITRITSSSGAPISKPRAWCGTRTCPTPPRS